MTPDDFGRLFQDHYSAVLGYGLRRVDAATAHDVAAETFAVAWQRLDAPPDVPLPWLLAVARRVLANEVRSRARRGQLVERVAHERSWGTAESSEGDAGTGPGDAQDVLRGLSRLSPQDQEVIRLIAWDELDHATAATVLGCSATAFRVRLHRARRRLRAAMQQPPDPAPAPQLATHPAPHRQPQPPFTTRSR